MAGYTLTLALQTCPQTGIYQNGNIQIVNNQYLSDKKQLFSLHLFRIRYQNYSLHEVCMDCNANCQDSSIIILHIIQPCSQVLSPLPPFVVGRVTLFEATSGTNFFTRIESRQIINFLSISAKERER